MFKDTNEGQTHSFNDGCGEPDHNEKSLLTWGQESFLTVCKEHKEKCDGNCNVSMFAIGKIYRAIIGRELTEEENKIFI